jgi:hypothetical protein
MRRLWRAVLPIIPVQSAPVVPNPVYHTVGLSLFQVLFHYLAPLVGVSYHWGWYSYLVLAGLLAAAVVLGALLLRKRA